MTPAVFAIVLLAALLHALWNAVVKGAGDRTVTLGLVALGHVVPGLALAAYVEAPAAASWPFIVASTVIHWGYYIFLNLSYRFGDLSLAYPVARGLAPVMIALGGYIWADEGLSPLAWIGIATVSGGILVLAVRRGMMADQKAIGAALVTSCLIAAYSVVDGLGIRASGSPMGYIAWLFSAEIFVVGFVLWSRRSRVAATPLRGIWLGLSGGVISSLAYALALWAKTMAPLGLVSALRETSVIFAALLGVVVFKEGPARRRLIAAAIVGVGIALLSQT